jgi:hypothetical protein
MKEMANKPKQPAMQLIFRNGRYQILIRKTDALYRSKIDYPVLYGLLPR